MVNCWCNSFLCNKDHHFFCFKSSNQREHNKRVWASYIKMKLPGHLLWHFQRISWIVLDWNSPPPPPPPLSLSWRTFAEVAKPSCPAPVADTTKMGVLMVFAKKKFEITFPRFTRQQKRCKRCKVHRQDAWSVSQRTITESKWSL